MIKSTKVTADKNPKHSTDPGKDTTDKVFLLSITEAEKYFSSDEERVCKPTAFAKENGAHTSISSGACCWMPRSPGRNSTYAAFVDGAGRIYCDGDSVDNGDGCVRPALWIEF